jgi:galactokinase
MTGGGFGGSIVALAWANEAERLANSVVSAYEGHAEARAKAYVCRASDGARVLRAHPGREACGPIGIGS